MRVDDMIFEKVGENVYRYALGLEESVVKKKGDMWEAFYRFGTYIAIGRGNTPEEAVKLAKKIVDSFTEKYPEFRCLFPVAPGKYAGKYFDGEKWVEKTFDVDDII